MRAVRPAAAACGGAAWAACTACVQPPCTSGAARGQSGPRGVCATPAPRGTRAAPRPAPRLGRCGRYIGTGRPAGRRCSSAALRRLLRVHPRRGARRGTYATRVRGLWRGCALGCQQIEARAGGVSPQVPLLRGATLPTRVVPRASRSVVVASPRRSPSPARSSRRFARSRHAAQSARGARRRPTHSARLRAVHARCAERAASAQLAGGRAPPPEATLDSAAVAHSSVPHALSLWAGGCARAATLSTQLRALFGCRVGAAACTRARAVALRRGGALREHAGVPNAHRGCLRPHASPRASAVPHATRPLRCRRARGVRP
jgi:hypothetical protein